MADAGRPRHPSAITRRGFLGTMGGVVAGGSLVGARGDRALAAVDGLIPATGETIPFYGARQAGVTTPAQRHGVFAVFDLQTQRRSDLIALLQRWTATAANMCAGRPADPLRPGLEAVEPDSGAALGLGPAKLTINFGFGPSLFGMGAPDRFGLRDRWPMALVEMPAFPGDRLTSVTSGGDLTVHACAEDPQVAFHAVQQLARAGAGTTTIRWSQNGFNETSASDGAPRNLMGFKDGIVNPTTDSELDRFVWVSASQDQDWMLGGTYLVVRRIRMLLGSWDDQSLEAQQRAIGRHKLSGAPLGERVDTDPLDLGARGLDGDLVIPSDAHVRLASAAENWGQMLLRRSYAFANGVSPLPGLGTSVGTDALDAGVLFFAYQQNPRLAFIPIYTRLAANDALRHFTVHTASAIAALPPGVSGPGHWVGEALFA
jgi:deferrochelatase/peroxidase EfeB